MALAGLSSTMQQYQWHDCQCHGRDMADASGEARDGANGGSAAGEEQGFDAFVYRWDDRGDPNLWGWQVMQCLCGRSPPSLREPERRQSEPKMGAPSSQKKENELPENAQPDRPEKPDRPESELPRQQTDTSFPGKNGKHGTLPRRKKDEKGRPGRIQRRRYQDYVATLEAQAAADPVSFDIEAIKLPPYITFNSWLTDKCKARLAAYLEAMSTSASSEGHDGSTCGSTDGSLMAGKGSEASFALSLEATTNASSEGRDGTDGSLVTGEEMPDEADANPRAHDQEKQMLAPFLSQKIPQQLSDNKQPTKKSKRRVQNRVLESKYRQGRSVTLQDAWLQPMLEAGKLSQSGRIPQVGPWKVELLSF